MNTRAKAIGKLVFGWPLSLLALFFIFRKISPNAHTILSNLEHINLFLLLLGIFSFMMYYLLRGYVWKEILRGFSYDLLMKDVVFRWASSELKRYIPGNIWSFLGRTVLFQEIGVAKGDTGKALLFEGQSILFSAIILSLLSFPLLRTYFFPQLHVPFFSILLFVGVIGMVLLFLFQKNIIHAINHDIKEKLFIITSPLSYIGNVKILSFSLLAFFFFGLGYYFVICSFLFLDPNQLFQFVGFFVFSLLVGLVSFITPTGLGVREGAITIGLSKVASVSTAGFAALFSRIILIVSELLFVFLSYLWRQTKETVIEKYIKNHKVVTLLLLCNLLYCLYFTSASFLRFDNFYTGRFDLGNMAQTVWNTSYGRIFQITNPNGTETISRLAFHSDVILVFLAPFYWIWESPKVLLLLQTIILSLGSIYVYLLGVKIIKRKDVALIFAVLYLLNPSVERVNLYDFHAVAFATTFLLASFYYILEKRYALFILFAILAGLTKEQVWFIVALFGGYIFLFQKKRVMGTSVFIISSTVGYLLISYVIPHVLGSKHFALEYYEDYGNGPFEIVKNILLSPISTAEKLLTADRITYLQQLFLPLGLLPLIGLPILIFAGPDLAINLLSSNGQLHQIYYQYTATITPFLFIAGIYGFLSLQKYFVGEKPRLLVIIFCVISSIGIYLYSPLPGMVSPNTDMFTKQVANRQEIDAFLATIPLQYSVSASNTVGSHLSHRENIYVIPQGVDSADYVVFMLNDPWAQPSPSWQRAKSQELRYSKEYILVFEKGDCTVFRKRNLNS